MSRKKTVPVPAEPVYAMARTQLESSLLRLEAIQARIAHLESELAKEAERLTEVSGEVEALQAFLGEDA